MKIATVFCLVLVAGCGIRDKHPVLDAIRNRQENAPVVIHVHCECAGEKVR
jgi:hypothetical protein